MRWGALLRLVVAAMCGLASMARAEDQYWQDCLAWRKDPARWIPACDTVIANRATSKARRANAYVNRGGAYHQ